MPRVVSVHGERGPPGRRRPGGVPMSRQATLRRHLPCAIVAAAALACSTPAHARNPTCSFTITNVAFGTVDLTANTTYDTTGTLSATCRGNNNATMRVCPNFNSGTG